ncbi:VOC family protein [Brenneria izadpanahii]|uniref:VOC family protein n=1 Tax=Brenneria izadpanahii TaxID=2722756 RepID=A0ABX7USH4_9GAMM|nr:VOC family protein [Brenneria izadpanahii]QTF08663.1 VOC family protein [Brenneria izadpanahii]
MSGLTPVVDHVVINVAQRLDDAHTLFQRLGFQLTPRGHHSLGSSNHLAIFHENYLELLGFETYNANQRKDLWSDPLGLSGLVWKTQDSDAVFQRLTAVGLAGDPPASFFRPVELPDGSRPEARFRTVRLAAERVANGRSFFCQHETPELVWRSEWQTHPNGVTDIVGFVISAADPRAVSSLYGTLFDSALIQPDDAGGFRLQAGKTTVSFITPQRAQSLYGEVAAGDGGSERMVALEFAVSSPAASSRYLQQQGIATHARSHDSFLVAARDAFNVALLFRAV